MVALELGLCQACRRLLREIGSDSRAPCGSPWATRQAAEERRSGGCCEQPSSIQRQMTGWSYEPPFDAVIRGLKFGRLDYLGGQLGTALAERFASDLADLDIVVPVPLHWWRGLHRGYNQAERIASALATRLGLPVRVALRRRRATRPQAQLERHQRTANVHRAFAPTFFGPRWVAGRRGLLVDDVVTTCNTLEAAASCLLAIGALSVTALAAGRTPDPANSGSGFARKSYVRSARRL
jgi:ComF family protein